MIVLLLSRLQLAFTISFHSIFPSFSIGLAASLTVLDALHLATRRETDRVPHDDCMRPPKVMKKIRTSSAIELVRMADRLGISKTPHAGRS